MLCLVDKYSFICICATYRYLLLSVCQVKQINDSRLVGMSIYNVAILCIITAPVTLVIADQQNATFAFVALANVFCCYLSMALVFVPKVFYLNERAETIFSILCSR